MKVLRMVLEDVEAQAHRSLPGECCGILLAGGGAPVVTCALAADNAETKRPSESYVLGHRAHIRAVEAEARGSARIVGYYHSHPGGSTGPSRRDTARAVGGVIYLITTLHEGSARHAAWRLEGGEMIPEPMQVYENETTCRDQAAQG